MVNKIINILLILLISSSSTLYAATYNGSTTAAVVLSGAIIKSQHVDKHKKYNRKDCPVCKGKGWYLSGDGLAKVPCGYCEEETKEVQHPPVIIRSNRHIR